jgi:hypothetical protein
MHNVVIVDYFAGENSKIVKPAPAAAAYTHKLPFTTAALHCAAQAVTVL